jgi:hypothetical protein
MIIFTTIPDEHYMRQSFTYTMMKQTKARASEESSESPAASSSDSPLDRHQL